APLHAALVAAGTDERAPDRPAVLRIQHGVDAALRADADDAAQVTVTVGVVIIPPVVCVPIVLAVMIVVVAVVADSHPHDVGARAAEIPFLTVAVGGAPCHAGRLPVAEAVRAVQPVRPARLAGLQIERDDRLPEGALLLALLREAVAGGRVGLRVTCGHTVRHV